MIDTEEPSPGFDIGVDHPPPAPADGSDDAAESSRSLPMWGLVLLALLLGWLLGSLLGGSTDDAPASGSPQIDNPGSSTAPTSSMASSGTRTIPVPDATLVLAQLSGSDRRPSTVTSINARGSQVVPVPDRTVGQTQSFGLVGQRVQVVGDTVVFVAGRQAIALYVGSDEPPEPITDAAMLLAGPGSGDVWALAADSRTLRLIDVASRTVRATYDLSGVGTPIASHNGGLVVVPDVARFGPFALWSPARGIERLWSLGDQAVFVDAAGNAIVVDTAQGLATYNTVTGALTQTELQLTGDESSAFVSPAGVLLAVTQPPESGPGEVVRIFDLATGKTTDVFITSAPWLATWVTNDTLLHVSPDDSTTVLLRNTVLGFDTVLTELDTDTTWMVFAD